MDIQVFGAPEIVESNEAIKAKALASGNTRGGNCRFWTFNTTFGPAVAQVVQYDLKQIGIDVEIKQFPFAAWQARIGTRGEPFDLTDDRFLVPWVDPYLYINVLLDGRTLQTTANLNRSYFNAPRYNKLLDRAGSLSGLARYDAYGKLAVDIERDAAPMAAYMDRNNRFFVSSRVGCVSVDAHGRYRFTGLADLFNATNSNAVTNFTMVNGANFNKINAALLTLLKASNNSTKMRRILTGIMRSNRFIARC